jgi:glycosyltransferase involved in cell wall biosynthesis
MKIESRSGGAEAEIVRRRRPNPVGAGCWPAIVLQLGPMLTVLLASHNGGHTLPRSLTAFCALRPPRGNWRLVVVDNASSDDTKSIVGSFMGSLPITYMHEARPGKNAALNTGLAKLSGDLVVLTDDDVVPRPDWLVELRALADAEPDFTVFGGAILPEWEAEPEQWILDWVNLSIAYAVLDLTMAEGPTEPGAIFGPNMAVRRAVFDAGYRFDEDVGPRGAAYAMGGESAFVRRLVADGHRCWHTRRAVVHHIIRRDQLTAAWILGRAIRFGRGQIRQRLAQAGDPPPGALGLPRYLIRQIAGQFLNLTGALLTRDRQRIFEARWHLNTEIGKVIEFRRFQTAKLKSNMREG